MPIWLSALQTSASSGSIWWLQKKEPTVRQKVKQATMPEQSVPASKPYWEQQAKPAQDINIGMAGTIRKPAMPQVQAPSLSWQAISGTQWTTQQIPVKQPWIQTETKTIGSPLDRLIRDSEVMVWKNTNDQMREYFNMLDNQERRKVEKYSWNMDKIQELEPEERKILFALIWDRVEIKKWFLIFWSYCLGGIWNT